MPVWGSVRPVSLSRSLLPLLVMSRPLCGTRGEVGLGRKASVVGREP